MRVPVVSSTGSELSTIVWQGTDPGRSALLVHGLASNALTWGGVAETLNEKGVTVVAVDQRSHGQSEVTEDGYTFATYAADLKAVVDTLGLDRPLVAGQSWGGNVVVEYGDRYPGACHAVVCVDGGAIQLKRAFSSWEDAELRLAPPSFEGVTLGQMRVYMTSNRPDWPAAGIEATLANFKVLDDGTVTNRLPRDKHMLILRSLFEHEPRQLVERLTVPVSLVAARPGPTPTDVGEWFPNTQFIDGDHDLHVQQPSRVADILCKAAAWQ